MNVERDEACGFVPFVLSDRGAVWAQRLGARYRSGMRVAESRIR
jgi:hypothetical protein